MGFKILTSETLKGI